MLHPESIDDYISEDNPVRVIEVLILTLIQPKFSN
jgi:hypothetical protein